MGQKVRPIGFRTGIMIPWQSTWFATKADFADLLEEDDKIRTYIKKRFRNGIAKVEIALAQGKKSWDRRQDERTKEARREVEQSMYRNRRR